MFTFWLSKVSGTSSSLMWWTILVIFLVLRKGLALLFCRCHLVWNLNVTVNSPYHVYSLKSTLIQYATPLLKLQQIVDPSNTDFALIWPACLSNQSFDVAFGYANHKLPPSPFLLRWKWAIHCVCSLTCTSPPSYWSIPLKSCNWWRNKPEQKQLLLHLFS